MRNDDDTYMCVLCAGCTFVEGYPQGPSLSLYFYFSRFSFFFSLFVVCVRYGTVQYVAVLYGTVPCGTVRYCFGRCILVRSVRCGMVWDGTLRYVSVPCGTVRYLAVWHSGGLLLTRSELRRYLLQNRLARLGDCTHNMLYNE